MTPDYSIFYRRSISVNNIGYELPIFDVFVSAFNISDRVRYVYDNVRAERKVWLVHPEYSFSFNEYPEGERVAPVSSYEVDQINDLIEVIGDVSGKRLCIDITGFMRHALIFLVAKLESMGVLEFTAVYTEPTAYSKQEDTAFSTTTSGRVRQVAGVATPMNHSKDAVVVGVGYDHDLISEVMNCKDGAVMRPIFAFPSLSADMYQQSAIRASRSGDKALDVDWMANRRFAPANDPFVNAEIVGESVRALDAAGDFNVYLSPLATKVQALGFAIYWVFEGRNRSSTAVLLPECVTYSRETSVGTKRVWAYTVEF